MNDKGALSSLEELKDELMLIANSRVTESGLSLRTLASHLEGVQPELLSRVKNYRQEGINIDRLIGLIAKLDQYLFGKVIGFDFECDHQSKTITLTYLGSLNA